MSKFDFGNYDYAPPDEAFAELIGTLEDAGFGFTDMGFRVDGEQWKTGEFVVRLVGGRDVATFDDAPPDDAEHLFATLEANDFEVSDRMNGTKDVDGYQAVAVEATIRWWPDGAPQTD